MLIDNHKELRAQYNPDGSDLRVAQMKMLQMLKFIDGVCNQLSISYWLESGTLLGAARHDGFIPWDDDVDICMLTDDYKIFEQYMLIHNPSKQYVLQCHLSDANYFGTWGVLRDLYNTYIKKDCRLNGFKYQGLQVDIFPVDRISRSRLCWKVCRWMYAWMVDAPLYKGRFLKYIRWNVPIAFFILTKVVIPFLHSISMEDKQNLFYRYGMFWWRKYNVDDLFPLGKLEFEGCVFNVPRNVDSYLTECFGDWKKVPPPEKRYNHNFGFHFMD